MKFKLIAEVEGETTTYGYPNRTGGVVDIKEPHLIEKAKKNPELQRVTAKKSVKKSGNKSGS